MSEQKTIRETVSYLEEKVEKLMDILVDNNRNITDELTKLNEGISETNKKVDKMYPIVRDIMYVKGYGSFTWKMLKFIGIAVSSCIISWHYFKDHIKHFIHYIFN